MDGYQVDIAALTDAANAAAELARATDPLVKQFGPALKDVAGGAPGSRSAAVAGRLPADSLSTQATQVNGIADKLKQTADEYQRHDAAAALALNKIKTATQPDQVSPGRIGSILDGG